MRSVWRQKRLLFLNCCRQQSTKPRFNSQHHCALWTKSNDATLTTDEKETIHAGKQGDISVKTGTGTGTGQIFWCNVALLTATAVPTTNHANAVGHAAQEVQIDKEDGKNFQLFISKIDHLLHIRRAKTINKKYVSGIGQGVGPNVEPGFSFRNT